MIAIEFAFLIFLLVLSAFFSSAETAFFSLNPLQVYRIRRQYPKLADEIKDMLANPARLLSTVLIGNTVVNITASVVGLAIVSRFFGVHAEIISIVSMTIILLVFGEITPKRLAVYQAEWMAIRYSPFLIRLIKIVSPLCRILEFTAKPFGKALVPYGRVLDGEEFRTLIAISAEGGILSDTEREMVDGILRLEKIRASDVMTPRVDIVALDLEDEFSVLAPYLKKSPFRYLLVYKGKLDNVTGVIDTRKYDPDESPGRLPEIMPVSFIPESARLNSILKNFQKPDAGSKVAVVVDEYGGVAGIVTPDDVLDEVLDIGDSVAGTESEILRVSEQSWVVNGSVSIEDLNNELGTDLQPDEADRVAGWVTEQFERMPETGETLRTDNL
ncbi:MAG: HlyC/CorC family transporter [Lentisphaerae bacterium]|nr:HlyC/CorC family transporter [Lentisphaerota bacterium]